ncbi:hypothetical protein JW960_06450 [candidate division KSB1 bacterium]|nr:hypothetical protein [candidate division KSB1 bacterium]
MTISNESFEQRKYFLRRTIARLERRLSKRQAHSRKYSWIRLAIFLTGLVLTILGALSYEPAGWAFACLSILIFIPVALVHRRIDKSADQHRLYIKIKQQHLARTELDWGKIPEYRCESPNPEHPFDVDLKICGPHSLHHLIDTAPSVEGSQLLRDWLLTTHPDKSFIAERQALLREMAPHSAFRDALLLNFHMHSDHRLEGKNILNWLKQRYDNLPLIRSLIIGICLSVINWILFVGNQAGLMPAWWSISGTVYILFILGQRKIWSGLLDEMIYVDGDLKRSMVLFRYLENRKYARIPKFAKMCQPFIDPKTKPSRLLNYLQLISIAVGLRSNMVLGMLLNVACPWDFIWAYQLRRAKEKLADQFPKWLETCSHVEALLSLSNFVYLHPHYHFPIIQQNETPFVQFKNIGHPLIPHAKRIHNDFAVEKLGNIALITGSNMSGKSTFLRTLGISLCLAYVGAPVDAALCRIPLMDIFTCMHVDDSLEAGISQFYAEVKRLKAVLMRIRSDGTFPVFFLVDEIYRGTNNRERLIGSKAYVRELLQHNAVGLISTHDLELTSMEQEFTAVKNYHFRETVVNNKMVFDYTLHNGPCPTTNALKIMQLEGLPVEENS